jgi:two-component system response regulator WspF
VRIAIANDSVLAVSALRLVLEKAGHTVAWIAANGQEAVERCHDDVPDVILMDLRMPVMNGVECTRRIMAETPCAILVVAAGVDDNFSQVYEAMGAGALDAVNTPVLGRRGELQGDTALISKVETMGKLVGLRAHRPKKLSRPSRDTHNAAVPPLVAIGASTGGPQALADILAALPTDLPAAIVIVQHVNAEFAEGLAHWLKDRSRFPTEVAVAGRHPEAGLALVAASDDHLIVMPDLSLSYTPNPKRYAYRPSVDVFFHSALEHWPRPSLGVLLTGMGKDGAAGLLALREGGWKTIAQDELTSVVYGMPKAAAEMGAAERVLALPRIPRAIVEHVGNLPRMRKAGR